MARMGKIYRESCGDCPMTPQQRFQASQKRADMAESYFKEHKCSIPRVKAQIALKIIQIKRIEDSNSSEETKVRRLKNLYPKDTCWHKYVESEY